MKYSCQNIESETDQTSKLNYSFIRNTSDKRNMLTPRRCNQQKNLECEILHKTNFFNKITGRVGRGLVYVKRYFRVLSAKIINAFFPLTQQSHFWEFLNLHTY